MSEKIVVVALGHRALGTTLPEQKIATQQQKKEKKGLSDGQEDFNMVKKKAKRMILLTVGALVVAVAGILAFRLMK